jgi:hypothetical protein
MSALVPSGARLVSGSALFGITDQVASGKFLLDVTAAGTLVGDTLDVYVQSSPDGGLTFDDFIHFTQVLGNGGAKQFTAAWSRDIAPTAALGPLKDGTLAAGVNQGPVSRNGRVKWVIVNGGGTHSFTFSVAVDFNRR